MRILGSKINFSLIVLVGVLITGIYMLSGAIGSAGEALIQTGHTLVTTAGIWLGCMTIVGYLWRKYPWELYPVKHLVIEIISIAIYTLIYGTLLAFIEIKLGILEPPDDPVIEIFTTLLITFLITSIYELAEFYRQWKYNFSKSVRLEKDNIQAKYEAHWR